MAQELPTGTVTFLFTDIEGSTSLLHELGPERYAEALAEHRLVFKNAIENWGGIVVDAQGDAFFVAFATATAAVRAAADAQRALAETEIRARMGLHSGEAIVAETGYVGADVHRGARICAAAHGAQVLLSHATRELVEDVLPDELGLRDLDEHRLKDLTRPQRLHQLLMAGLPADFPPLRTLEQRPTNLPVQPAPLIGRERELREARELLAGTRLLTLTGAGGTGKTRLAIQLAADVLDDYDDGAFFVDLADVADPALVVPTVAQVLGVKERGGLEVGEAVADYLRRRGGPRGQPLDGRRSRGEAARDQPDAASALGRAGVSRSAASDRRRGRALRRAGPCCPPGLRARRRPKCRRSDLRTLGCAAACR